ncbi:MAG: host-nuclease inhibitor Gam family protein [Muribaculaceae bacterium]|nr:host-nuclease inhibitor Gam family protein [Muribaculaceae bacterium]
MTMVKEFMTDFIRTTEEIAKDKLLADREADGMAEKMEKCGIYVAQDETFYVEPKKEEA